MFSGDVTLRTNPAMTTGDVTSLSSDSTTNNPVPFPKRSPFRIFGYETGRGPFCTVLRSTAVGAEASQIGGMCTCVVWYLIMR